MQPAIIDVLMFRSGRFWIGSKNKKKILLSSSRSFINENVQDLKNIVNKKCQDKDTNVGGGIPLRNI